jgi:hypothetical protein
VHYSSYAEAMKNYLKPGDTCPDDPCDVCGEERELIFSSSLSLIPVNHNTINCIKNLNKRIIALEKILEEK